MSKKVWKKRQNKTKFNLRRLDKRENKRKDWGVPYNKVFLAYMLGKSLDSVGQFNPKKYFGFNQKRKLQVAGRE